MKKILSAIMACVLAFAVMIPCVAETSRTPTASAPISPIREALKVGTWPQTRISEEGELAYLTTLLDTHDLNWMEDVLPNGRRVRYTDIADDEATYRVVCTDDEVLWYRWEPLLWKYQNYHGYDIWVCTSVVFAVENNADVFRAWLADTFYRTAFSRDEQASWFVAAPTFGITQSRTASVGDYAALYGATGQSYYERVLPTSLGSDPVSSSRTPRLQGVGVRPIITRAFEHSHQATITLPTSRGASWIRCLLCWLFH